MDLIAPKINNNRCGWMSKGIVTEGSSSHTINATFIMLLFKGRIFVNLFYLEMFGFAVVELFTYTCCLT